MFETEKLEEKVIGKASFVKPLSFNAKKDTKADISMVLVVKSTIFDDISGLINQGLRSEDGDLYWDTKLLGHDLAVEDIVFEVRGNNCDERLMETFQEIQTDVSTISDKVKQGVKLKLF